jgi:hypothetical protein
MGPDDLVEIEQIKRVKYRYCRLLDQKRFEELGPLFTDDATASYGGGALTLAGRDEIVSTLGSMMGSTDMLTSHHVGHPEIDLVGPDEATGTWALQDVVVLVEMGFTIRGASFYEDRYARADGRWLISHTGYKRTYEEIEPRGADVRLTASWWGTDGRSTLT